VLKSRRYDETIRKLIDMILSMTPDERGMLLKEAEQIKAKLRATRRNCCVPILLHYGDKVHASTVTNLSFTGAFVECSIPVMIGEPATVEFKNLNGFEDLKLDARIIHANIWGIGLRFKTVRSTAARFLQKCLDDFR
jgi:PilZ domain